MPTVQVEANLSYGALLQAVEQLSPEELGQLETAIRALLEKRRDSGLPHEEPRLLVTINQSLPDNIELRYKELLQRRQDETLTPEEHRELVALSDRREDHWAARLAAPIELARLRGVELPDLLQQLGLHTTQGKRPVV